MHTCPDCGQACYCCDDLDDCPSGFDEAACLHCFDYRLSSWEQRPWDDPVEEALVGDAADARARAVSPEPLDKRPPVGPIATSKGGVHDGGPR